MSFTVCGLTGWLLIATMVVMIGYVTFITFDWLQLQRKLRQLQEPPGLSPEERETYT